MSHKFNPTILREYDIRGIVGSTLHEEDAYALGRTYAAIAVEEGARRLADAHLSMQFESIPVTFTELIIFRSELSSKGSKYTAISRNRFTGLT